MRAGNVAQRPDLELIANLIPPGSKVLDIGCEYGALLRHLRDQRQVDGRGIELDQEKVAVCVANGLSVVQGNADNDLAHYPDKAFDVAILSIALQMMHRPKDVLENMLRIADKAIVAIPNFGHWKNRLYLMFKGRMPVTSSLSYQWYETPNIHFCTLKDFTKLANEVGATIEQQFTLADNGEQKNHSSLLANLTGSRGVFLLSS